MRSTPLYVFAGLHFAEQTIQILKRQQPLADACSEEQPPFRLLLFAITGLVRARRHGKNQDFSTDDTKSNPINTRTSSPCKDS